MHDCSSHFYSVFGYSPSRTASIRMPTIIMEMNRYCFFVSFSFRKILDSSKDTTHTLERMGAAMAPLPLIAYTYVNCPAVSNTAERTLSVCFGIEPNSTFFIFINPHIYGLIGTHIPQNIIIIFL